MGKIKGELYFISCPIVSSAIIVGALAAIMIGVFKALAMIKMPHLIRRITKS